MVAKAFEMGWAGVAFKTIGLFTPDEVSPRFAALEKRIIRLWDLKILNRSATTRWKKIWIIFVG